ncbi:GNAT family N-acetyltransferase [Pseudorhodoferax soli]|uniref:GNAT family N-acetyltransferase n=1 Tax=Pseudorhodoferax soli TaxID=545864 RepID=UPI000DF48EBF|nr:GNAT family N-acetyltransferase [Pseudorhodoferax soli]
MESLQIVTAADKQDVVLIHRFLSQESAWAKGIPFETVRESVRNSLNFGGLIGASQIAYARVVSDYATFADLLDVFVLPEHRDRGYSAQLMAAVMAHPRLQGLRRFMLHTSTAHRLYAKYGFTPPARPEILMERFIPNAYGHGL